MSRIPRARADRFSQMKQGGPSAAPIFPPLCRICRKPVLLEDAHTDEFGTAVHEECYVLKLRLEEASRDGSK